MVRFTGALFISLFSLLRAQDAGDDDRVIKSAAPMMDYGFAFCEGGNSSLHLSPEEVSRIYVDGDLGDSQHIWGAESFTRNRVGILYTGSVDGTIYAVQLYTEAETKVFETAGEPARKWRYDSVVPDAGRVLGLRLVQSNDIVEVDKASQKRLVKVYDRILAVSISRQLITFNVVWKGPLLEEDEDGIASLEDQAAPLKLVKVTKPKVVFPESYPSLSLPNSVAVFKHNNLRVGAVLTNSADYTLQRIAMAAIRVGTGSLIYIPDIDDAQEKKPVTLLESLGMANGIACRWVATSVLECWVAETSIIGRLKQVSLEVDQETLEARVKNTVNHYVGPVMIDNVQWMNLDETSEDERAKTHLTLAFHHITSRVTAKTLLRLLPLPPWFTDGVFSVLDRYFDLVAKLLNSLPLYSGFGIYKVEGGAPCLEVLVDAEGAPSDISSGLAGLTEARLINLQTGHGFTDFEFALGYYGAIPFTTTTVRVPDVEVEDELVESAEDPIAAGKQAEL